MPICCGMLYIEATLTMMDARPLLCSRSYTSQRKVDVPRIEDVWSSSLGLKAPFCRTLIDHPSIMSATLFFSIVEIVRTICTFLEDDKKTLVNLASCNKAASETVLDVL